jgi:predicted DNA-binding transcriptional regulator AlpA
MSDAAKKALTSSVRLAVEGLLTVEDLADVLHVSRRTIFRLRSRGALPAPVELSTNIVRWRPADVREFLDRLRRRKGRRPRAVRS